MKSRVLFGTCKLFFECALFLEPLSRRSPRTPTLADRGRWYRCRSWRARADTCSRSEPVVHCRGLAQMLGQTGVSTGQVCSQCVSLRRASGRRRRAPSLPVGVPRRPLCRAQDGGQAASPRRLLPWRRPSRGAAVPRSAEAARGRQPDTQPRLRAGVQFHHEVAPLKRHVYFKGK